MSRLKPIGSEKLKGQAQINRILEIAKYKENLPNSINENEKIDYTTKLVDGNVYHIVRETKGYIIKVGLNESVSQYIEPMQNRNYYTSYADALKRLNLLAKELNRIHNVNEGISLFTEDKKYFIKTPTPKVENTPPPPPPPPMPEPTETPALPSDSETIEPEMPETPEMGDGEMPEMPEEPADEMPNGGPDESDIEGDVTFKTIQKLTGKLAQKIRDYQSQGEEEISSKDAKYVVNSILSALADNLEDDDKDDIITKLEGEEEGGEEMGIEDDNMPEEDGMTDTEEMPEDGNEMKAGGEMGENYNVEEDLNEKYLDKVMGGIFGESKVDKVLSNYFVLNENEIKFREEKKKQKKLFLEQKRKSDKNHIIRLSESSNQKKVAIDVINSFPEMKFIGKTNKGNLVFEHNNKQLKVSPKGELL